MRCRHWLLVALPLDRDSFHQRYEHPEVGDMVRSWDEGMAHPQGVEGLWSSYAMVADRVRKVSDEAAYLGVRVVHQATWANLQSAIEEDAPFSLFAHWKNARVFQYDPLDARAVLNSMDATRGEISLWLRQLVGPRELDRLQNLQGVALQAGVAQALDGLITEQDLSPNDSCVLDDPDEFRTARNRTLLDRHFQGSIRPGNRLELWDQMVDETTFANAIPTSRERGIDMAVCNSAVLARRLQFSTNCPILSGRRKAGILFRLHFFEQAVRYSIQSNKDYIEAAFDLIDAILEPKE